jgi:hypothetical protein
MGAAIGGFSRNIHVSMGSKDRVFILWYQYMIWIYIYIYIWIFYGTNIFYGKDHLISIYGLDMFP